MLFFAAAVAAPLAAGPDFSPPVIEYVERHSELCTASGLRLVVDVRPGSGVASVATVVDAGSRYDAPGYEGLAHLVQHLWMRSTDPAGRSVQDTIAGIGRHQTHTGPDAVVYTIEGGERSLPHMLALEGSRLLDPLAGVDAGVFAGERDLVVREFSALAEDGEGGVSRYLWALLYPAPHPYARVGLHYPAQTARWTLADARAFVAARYRPDHTTVHVQSSSQLSAVRGALAAAAGPGMFAEGLPDRCPTRIEAAEPPEVPTSTKLLLHRAPVTPFVVTAFTVPGGFGTDLQLARMATTVLDDSLEGDCRVAPARLSSTVVCSSPARATGVIEAVLKRNASRLIALQDGSKLGYADEAFEGVRTPWKLRLLRDSVSRLVPTAIGTVVPFIASHSDGSGYLAAALTAIEGVRQKDLVAYV